MSPGICELGIHAPEIAVPQMFPSSPHREPQELSPLAIQSMWRLWHMPFFFYTIARRKIFCGATMGERRMSWAARKVASPRVINVEDLRRLAQRRVPKVVFDYVGGGAEGEVTLRENCRAF